MKLLKSLPAHLVLKPNDSIDLQMHTIYSDGSWTPEQLMDYLVSEQFGLVAITDHDRVDTAAELQQLAAEKHLPLLTAVEMSTSWRGESTDVLSYGFDVEHNELQDMTQDIMCRRQENTREVCENFHRIGIAFSQSELNTLLAKPGSQQLNELFALLQKRGYDAEKPSTWKLIEDAGFSSITSDIAAVVDAVHRSGGVCLIAHPGRGSGETRYDVHLLDELRKEVPIDGMEVYYPDHTPEQMNMYLEYAEKHNLLTSSGSDSHGLEKKPIKYQAKLSRRLLERLGIQVQ